MLDFSSLSESEETEEEKQGRKRKASNMSSDRNVGKTTSASGRMSLLQHGFSRLLERVKERPDKSSSSGTEDTSSEEDAEDQKMKNAVESGAENWSTERKSEDRRDEAFQETVRMKEKRVEVVEDINSSPEREPAKKHRKPILKSHHFQDYSDESDDLDLEAKARPSKEAFGLSGRGGESGKSLKEKRRSASVRDKTRSKYTADIEEFTSSEDEAGKGAVRPKAVSFTSLRKQTSPASKERNRTIDCVLGLIHSFYREYIGTKSIPT